MVILLVASALLSATEASFFSLNRVQLRRFERDGRSSSKRVLRLLSKPSHLLVTILTGSTLVNIAFSVVVTTAALRLFGEHGVEIAIVVSTLAILLLGEVTPKTLAVNFPEAFSRTLVHPFRFFSLLLAPFTSFVGVLSDLVLRALGQEKGSSAASPSITRGELDALLQGADRQGIMTPHESRLVQNILQFSSTRAAEVMTPRVDMVAASIDLAPEELAELFAKSKHSRIPIHRGAIDEIFGYVKARDVLLHPASKIEEMVRPIAIYPDAARISEIFYETQRNRAALTIVVNEYGETVGLLTREDLLEELVGEIYDEYELRDEPLRKLGPDRWSAVGQIGLEELNESLGIDLPVEDAYTLSGLIANLAGGIPPRNAVLRYENVVLTVLEVSRHRVQRVQIDAPPAPSPPDAGARTENGADSDRTRG